MNPVIGFILFFAAVVVMAVVAVKRGLRWWTYLVGYMVATLVLVKVSARAGVSSLDAGIVAMLILVVALVLVLLRKNTEQLAISNRVQGDFGRHPFCSAAVRREAKNYKHYGSELTSEWKSV